MTIERMLQRIAPNIRSFPWRGPKVVFTHIPKCGGTSVGTALATRFNVLNRMMFNYKAETEAATFLADKVVTTSGLKDDLLFWQFMLCSRLNSGWCYVTGHHPVNQKILERYQKDYLFITLLRDPVARWKSQYRYNKQVRRPQDSRLPNINFNGPVRDEFEMVIQSNVGFLMGSLMSTMLTGIYPEDHNHAVELSHQAYLNLQLYHCVGTLENLDSFILELSEILKKKLSIGMKNVTEAQYPDELQDTMMELADFLEQPDVERQIYELCAPDRALYAAYVADTAGLKEPAA